MSRHDTLTFYLAVSAFLTSGLNSSTSVNKEKCNTVFLVSGEFFHWHGRKAAYLVNEANQVAVVGQMCGEGEK